MKDKTPLLRFLADQGRKGQREFERTEKRMKEVEAVKKLCEEAFTAVSILRKQGDSRSAEVVQGLIDALEDYADLRSKAEHYDDAHYYMERVGYWYRSAVEEMPTVRDMLEKALNHRSQIQGHLEAALKHLGVGEPWLVRIRAGYMDEFFQAAYASTMEGPLFRPDSKPEDWKIDDDEHDEPEEAEADFWRNEYYLLASRIGVPRVVLGDVRDPDREAISSFLGAFLPSLHLRTRFDEFEADVKKWVEDVREWFNKHDNMGGRSPVRTPLTVPMGQEGKFRPE